MIGTQVKQEAIPVAQKITTKLRSATAPELIQVAPGKFMQNGHGKLPDVVLASLRPCGDGTFQVLPITERIVRLTPALVRRLGFGSDRGRTLKRLGVAGFIEVMYPAPKCAMINLDSWYNHLRRVAEDPFFWEKAANKKAYQQAL